MTDLQSPEQVNSTEFNLRSGSFQLSLRFEPEALATLGREIGTGYVSVPRRAAETGGLLTGEIVQNDSAWIVNIQDVTPVSIQYEYGPSYRLSAADKEVFRYLTDKEVFGYLAEDHAPGARRIGWYRSNTRPRHEPEEEDREISRTFFESDQNIFLYCDVSPDSQVHATCIVITPNHGEVAFPFEPGRFTELEEMRKSERKNTAEPIAGPQVEAVAARLQNAGPEKPGDARSEETAGPPVGDADPFEALITALAAGPQVEPVALPPKFTVERLEPRITSPPPAPRAKPVTLQSPGEAPRHYFSGANLRFAAAVAAAGAIAYYARGRVPTPAAPPALAKPVPESQVAAVPAADSNVDDSPGLRALGLRAEYQGSSLLLGWDRTSSWVNAATSGVCIIADGPRTRVLTLSPRELRNGGILYKPTADDINVELQIIEPRGRTASQSIRIVGAPPPASASAPIGQIARRVLRQPPAPRREARKMPVEGLEAPPPATEQRSITTVDAPLINQEAKMVPPWFAATLMPPPPQPMPVASSPLTLAAKSGPTLTKPDGDADPAANPAPGFHPATAIHAPQPLVPQGMYFPQYIYDHPVEVKVEISINAAGRVTNTRLVDTTGPYASQLGPPALNTARAWIFQPATLRGRPVASTMVLTFRYTRPR